MNEKAIKDILSENQKYIAMNPKQKEVAIEIFTQIKPELLHLNLEFFLDFILREE